jgi:hypothetical protein
MGNVGNAWHIPESPGPGELTSMRHPSGAIVPGMAVTICSGNQFRGAGGNPGNQLQVGSALLFKCATHRVWQRQPMLFHSTVGNNKYYTATVPTATFEIGDIVNYYLRISYDDHDTTFIHCNGDGSATTSSEAVARRSPFTFTIERPIARSRHKRESVARTTGEGPTTEDHLRFTVRLLDRLTLPPEQLKSARSRLRAIQKRHSDPVLRLAVVGEFSSGKSALVNALLRDRLLPSKALEATAVATEVWPGPGLSWLVRLDGQTRWMTPDRHMATLCRRLGVSELPSDPYSALALLTTDVAIAEHIHTLKVFHPASALGEGTVLIDTPGIDGLNARGYQVVERIVREEADAFVVVVPGVTAFSITLVDFLREHLLDQIQHCIFIITKVDQIEPQERKDLFAYIDRVLADRIGAIQPAGVFPVVPSAVLSAGKKDSEHLQWASGFTQAQEAIKLRLQERRTEIIDTTVRRLLADLLAEVDLALTSQQQQLAIDELRTRKVKIRHFGAFATQSLNGALGQMSGAARAAHVVAESIIDEATTQVHVKVSNDINQTHNISELKLYLRNGLPEQINKLQDTASTTFAKQASMIIAEAQAVGKQTNSVFCAEYAKLEQLVGVASRQALKAGSPLTLRDLPRLPRGQSNAEKAILTNQIGWASAGAGAGALIGTAIAPVIGTVIGAAVGALLRPGVGSMRSKVLNGVMDVVDRTSSDLRESVDTELQKVDADCERWVRELHTAISRRYSGPVQQASIEHRQTLERITRTQKRLTEDRAAIAKRLAKLPEIDK